ncbi:M56 family metallopeptidase [Nocardia concava]|uniref:M56 family metallopeptidase n=1 Tax=Nocardia concava TaxID=257281 RepID=UPI00031EC407|nr:M56 family metallopeptidase [Nocardia concava]
MSIALCLFVYGFTVAVFAPSLLRRLGRSGLEPRAGLTAWLVSIGLVGVAWTAALAVLAVDLLVDLIHSRRLSIVDSCVTELHDAATGRYGFATEAGLLTLAGLSAAALAVTLVKLARILLRTRATSREHARMTRIAGRHNAELDAVVVDVDHLAAYCVAGDPPTVVVTSGVIAALGPDQLAAVLAHERAHVDGRHHLILMLTRGLATVVPWLRLFTVGAAEVARLLELCADDVAARTHGPGAVRQALITLSKSAVEPVGALGVGDAAVTGRLERLASWRHPTPATPKGVRAGMIAVILVPLVPTLATVIGIAVCVPVLP